MIKTKALTLQNVQNRQKSMEEWMCTHTKCRASTTQKHNNANKEQHNTHRNRHSMLEDDDIQREENTILSLETEPKEEAK